jgi:hypothetical protein
MQQVQDLTALVAALGPLGTARPRTVIAIDGVDGAGKSCLARGLREKIGGSLLALDDFLDSDRGTYVPSLRLAEIGDSIEQSLDPLIIEGVCLLAVLQLVGVKPTQHVYVKRIRPGGAWMDEEECDPEEPVDELIERLGSGAKALSALLGSAVEPHTASGLTGAREEIIRYHADTRPSRRADVVFLRMAAA